MGLFPSTNPLFLGQQLISILFFFLEPLRWVLGFCLGQHEAV